jgi:hypothetical protein
MVIPSTLCESMVRVSCARAVVTNASAKQQEAIYLIDFIVLSLSAN